MVTTVIQFRFLGVVTHRCLQRFGFCPGLDQHLKFACRSKSSVPDKIKVGKAIKRLNKENKYLFGDLFNKSGPRETKKASSKSQPQAQPLDGIQSEIAWYKSIGQKSYEPLDEEGGNGLTVGEGRSLDLFPSQNHINKLDQIKLSDIGKRNEPTVSHSLVDSSKSSVITGSNNSTQSKESLDLPNIIIRNIQTFPLFNSEKMSDDSPSLDVLSVSRENEKYYSYPSVTRILNATMSDASIAALARWKQKMVAELGEEGFLVYQDGLLRKGAEFHRTIYDHLSGVPGSELQIDPDVVGSWCSLSSVIPALSRVKALESHVVHPQLMYRGVVDCVADYKGRLAVIEWKKSDKSKRQLANTYDAPLQLAAYLGAMNYDNNYPFQAQLGAVVVAYSDGSPADVFPLRKVDCAHYWLMWQSRFHKYWQQQSASVHQQSD